MSGLSLGQCSLPHLELTTLAIWVTGHTLLTLDRGSGTPQALNLKITYHKINI